MAKFEITWLEDTSDEAVLAEIRRVAGLAPGQRLTVEEFNLHAKIKSEAVRKRFGSWSEATRRAGLAHALPEYSDVMILEDLKRVSKLFPNELFTNAFYSMHGRYSSSIIKRHLGGWKAALVAAGIGDRFQGPLITERMKTQPGRTVDNEEILSQLRSIAVRLGKPALSGADIAANSNITQAQLFRRFGGTSAALKLAGVEQVSHGKRHTENEVFENLLEVWTHYGRPPTVSEMDRAPSVIGKNTYLHRFGGWRKALKAFIERANGESIGEAEAVIKSGPTESTIGDRPRESPSAGTAVSSAAQHTSSALARPRAMNSTKANLPPADRREPSIGLRYKVLQRDNFRCCGCGRSPATDIGCKLHVDHVVAFSRGGKTTLDNLQSLCAACNIGKSNRPG